MHSQHLITPLESSSNMDMWRLCGLHSAGQQLSSFEHHLHIAQLE